MNHDDVDASELIEFLTTAGAAAAIGVKLHHIQRLCERGRIPYSRFHHIRLIRESDLDRARAACVAAGYLPEVKKEATKSA